MTRHFGLYFNRVEHLSVVNTHNTSNHLWYDDHISQMSFDNGRLLIGRGILFCFAEFLNETHGTALETALETTASASVDELF